MNELLLYEVDFQVSFDGSYNVVNFEAYDEHSTVDGVICRRVLDARGVTTGWQPSLLIRDRGNPNQEAAAPRYAVVVRRMGRATPIPQFCGRYVGCFATDDGDHEWYVFAPRTSSPGASPLVSQRGHVRTAGSAPPYAPSATSPSHADREAETAPGPEDSFGLPD